MTRFRNTTNYIVLILGRDWKPRYTVLDCRELEELLLWADAREDPMAEMVQGTKVFCTMPEYMTITVREYQGGEIDQETFLVSPSVGR